MKRAKILTLISSALACGVFMQQSALAGGASLYEISTPDVGLASAGYAAGAQDASTLFKNPAGMSLLTGPQLESSLQVLYGNVQFQGNSKTTTSGGNMPVTQGSPMAYRGEVSGSFNNAFFSFLSVNLHWRF
jgi:long-subunit fatty acid transport protein